MSEGNVATNIEIAHDIISAYAKMRRDSQKLFMTYGELAVLIGKPGQHAILGGALDRVRDICAKQGLPDIATVIVNKQSWNEGTLLPSPSAIEKYNGWPDLRQEQARVIAFNWAAH